MQADVQNVRVLVDGLDDLRGGEVEEGKRRRWRRRGRGGGGGGGGGGARG
jgi:hypothetical protein